MKSTGFPVIKNENNFYEQRSVLKRSHIPTSLYDSLTSSNIKKFQKMFKSISKNRKYRKYLININNNNKALFINNSKADNSALISNNNKAILMKLTTKSSLINTKTELKIKKLMDKFNNDKKQKKNVEYELNSFNSKI